MSLAAAFERQTKVLHDHMRRALGSQQKATTFTAVTVVSMNDSTGGQWILNDPSQDKRMMATRLRMAADILEGLIQ